jgi:tetraacyldisaccharide 4'-kinase
LTSVFPAKAPRIRAMRKLLLPFSALYGLATGLRNRLYDLGWMRSFAFDAPVIAVGNLQVGGTGKTPLVAWLACALGERYPVGILSRGYGRSTRGYLLAGSGAQPEDIGDEPALLQRLCPDAEVAVGEARVPAIPALLLDAPATRVVLCDDAMQHRALRPGLTLLLTGYGALYTRDRLLPAGRLREARSGARRAQAIVVTGCPRELDAAQREALSRELRAREDQPVFFAGLAYGRLRRLGEPWELAAQALRAAEAFPEAGVGPQALAADTGWGDTPAGLPSAVLLLTGIARPLRMVRAVEAALAPGPQGAPGHCDHMAFPDHHRFGEADLKRLRARYERLRARWPDAIILTTEKDAVRLEGLASRIDDLPVWVQPVRLAWLPGQEEPFRRLVFDYCANGELGSPAAD